MRLSADRAETSVPPRKLRQRGGKNACIEPLEPYIEAASVSEKAVNSDPEAASTMHDLHGEPHAADMSSRIVEVQRGKHLMKTIGLIGGMSWESTVPYYRLINEAIKERLGGLHSAKIVLYSVDFHEIELLQRTGDWETAGQQLADAARRLESAGADFLLICANTMHKVAGAVEKAVNIPLLHVVDGTARKIRAAGFQNVGLLGTRFTMEQAFYTDRLQQHGLHVITPNQDDRDFVHRSIYEELCVGKFLDASRAEYRRVIDGLARQGAEAVILGCTEIALLVKPEDSPLPLFDTTSIHAHAAVDYALGLTNGGK
jgi:aspartate racemase